MLRIYQDGSYLITDKDLIIALQYAWNNHNEEMIEKLNTLFTNVENIIMLDKTSYHKTIDQQLIDYLLNKVKLQNYETYIDRNILKEGYVISKYEKNHDMNKRIYAYLTKYLNNEINGLSNDILKQEIINDKLLLKYLKRYENLDDFITKKINKKVSMQDNYYVKDTIKEKKKVA